MASISRGFKYLFHNPSYFVDSILTNYLTSLPDKLYLSIRFRCKMGYWMNWKNPKTFNEKLQWLKLYNRNPEHTLIVDKYSAKDYVKSLIGEQYVIPTLGVWNTVQDIEWDKLPDRFVLKTTHGGGNTGVVICRDKATFDKESAIKKLQQSLKSDIYRTYREWPYKDVPKRIIAEKYIEDKNGELNDYKFTCTNGVAHNVMICLERGSGDTKFYFFDKDWQLLRLNKRGLEAPENFTLPKPQNIDKMFEIASKLSKGLPYARVDLYNVDGAIYFGEITFFPQSGFDSNLLKRTDIEFGSLIDLNILDK